MERARQVALTIGIYGGAATAAVAAFFAGTNHDLPDATYLDTRSTEFDEYERHESIDIRIQPRTDGQQTELPNFVESEVPGVAFTVEDQTTPESQFGMLDEEGVDDLLFRLEVAKGDGYSDLTVQLDPHISGHDATNDGSAGISAPNERNHIIATQAAITTREQIIERARDELGIEVEVVVNTPQEQVVDLNEELVERGTYREELTLLAQEYGFATSGDMIAAWDQGEFEFPESAMRPLVEFMLEDQNYVEATITSGEEKVCVHQYSMVSETTLDGYEYVGPAPWPTIGLIGATGLALYGIGKAGQWAHGWANRRQRNRRVHPSNGSTPRNAAATTNPQARQPVRPLRVVDGAGGGSSRNRVTTPRWVTRTLDRMPSLPSGRWPRRLLAAGILAGAALIGSRFVDLPEDLPNLPEDIDMPHIDLAGFWSDLWEVPEPRDDFDPRPRDPCAGLSERGEIIADIERVVDSRGPAWGDQTPFIRETSTPVEPPRPVEITN